MTCRSDDRHAKERTVVERSAGMLETAAAAGEREGAALWNEHLLHLDVLTAGADHSHRVPGIDDDIVFLRHEAQPPVDRCLSIVAVHGDGEHVPFGVVHAGGEGP